jgi:hypothetical protein
VTLKSISVCAPEAEVDQSVQGGRIPLSISALEGMKGEEEGEG